MLRKILLVLLLVLIAGGVAVVLYARSVLASENVRTTLEQRLTEYFGQRVQIGSATAALYPRVALDLGNVTVGEQPHVALNRVSISTGLRGLFSRHIEGAEVVLAGGRVMLPAALSLTAPRPAAQANAGLSSPALTIVSVRVIALQDVELLIGSTSMHVNLESALESGRLEVSRLRAESARTQLDATGTVVTSTRHGTIDVTANPLDVDELLTIASGLTPPASREEETQAIPMRLEVSIKAPQGRFAGYDFSNCAAKLEATSGHVAMPALAFRIFGGEFSGSLNLDATTATPRLELRGDAGGIDVAQLAATAGRPGSMTGRLATKLAVSAAGDDAQSLLRSVHGTADGAIRDGSIPGLEMVRTIVLAFGKPSGAPPPGRGSAFTRLAGRFNIQGGVVRSDNFTFASRDFDMGGRASLAVKSGAIDALVDVVLSKELTAQAGTDLRRYAESDGRVIIPAHIAGTINHPLISLDLASAARRALENELKRRAKSLLGDLFKRKKGGG